VAGSYQEHQFGTDAISLVQTHSSNSSERRVATRQAAVDSVQNSGKIGFQGTDVMGSTGCCYD